MYRVHHFDSSEDAYDACLAGKAVRENDVVVAASEGVVGLASTDPIAVTITAGALKAFPAMTREDLLAELVHGAATIGRAVDEALRHRFPVAPSFLAFAGFPHRLLPNEASLTLTLDDITSIGDAIDHRLAVFAELSKTVDPESSRGLFLAQAITRLREGRVRLFNYTKSDVPPPASGRP
ncbi:hypothetical protein [Sphingomonas lacusdianchii]|uniref:hypothetical protein n=1 Tax=Sphingomonas lacusdianchii TaxID=2917992 RepID=UPI001F59C6DB|nr:hypothetical protein [Sphingomonas sp. JXJ CY 53]